MTDDITISWQPQQSEEGLSSVDAVVGRLIEITLGTTPDSGVAVVIAKLTGQAIGIGARIAPGTLPQHLACDRTRRFLNGKQALPRCFGSR